MTVETKKIDKKVLMKEYSRVFAFNFDEKRIDLYLAKEKEIKRRLVLEVILKSKSNRVKVILNPYTEQSFWNFKKNYINIGLLESFNRQFPAEKLADIAVQLFYHEVSHENNTEVCKEVPYPFSLLNILEDERIERIASREWAVDFSLMHEVSWELFYKRGAKVEDYLNKENAKDFFERVFNPFNYIIVRRWRRWSKVIELDCKKIEEEYVAWKHFAPHWIRIKEIQDKLKAERGYEYTWQIDEDFKADVERVLDDATRSENTEKLIENTLWFWEKWKDLLQPEAEVDILMGLGHGEGKKAGDLVDPEEKLEEEAKKWINGELELDEDKEVEKSWSTYEIDEDFIRESRRFMDEPIWRLDEDLVKRLENVLKRIVYQKKNTKSERTTFGKRIDPRRVENMLPNPMKRNVEAVETIIPKVLFVVDGSGSMMGNPYRNALHLVTAFENVLGRNVQIVVTTPERACKVSSKELLRFRCDGEVENLISVKEMIESDRYDLIIFFTDAEVLSSDMKFLHQLKESQWREKVIGMVTTLSDVNKAKKWLSEAFYKSIVARDIENLVKELAFRIKRKK